MEAASKDVTAYITLTEATKVIPSRRSGKKISVQTVWRWCMRGVRSGIRLRSVMIGGQRCTTLQWIEEFIKMVSEAAEPANAADLPCPRTTGKRQSASDRAMEELNARWHRNPKSQSA